MGNLLQPTIKELFDEGDKYFYGKGCKINYKEAEIYYRGAAERGHKESQYAVGYLRSKEKDYLEAAKWYRKAAERGIILAQHELGDLYLNGYGLKQDYKKAFLWFSRAAGGGNTESKLNIAIMHEKGIGAELNKELAKKWFIKAAIDKHYEAYYKVGYYYEHGLKKNMDKAFEWYLKAAETGNTDAFYAIGRLYETVFIKKDVRKAIQYYELASELPEACYALGRLYEFCDIIQNDNEKALKLYEKAVGIVDAEFALGLMYENGKGVDQDYDRALELYQSAADKGLVKAYAALGSIYSKMEDHESAFNWNRKAAEHGSEQGIYNLAKMIDSEEGDTKRAFDLYHKLAEGGNAYCQYLIATKYEKGIGVEQSDALAIKWFTLANKGDYKTPPF